MLTNDTTSKFWKKKTNIGWQWAYDYHLYTRIDDFFGYFEALLHIFKPYELL